MLHCRACVAPSGHTAKACPKYICAKYHINCLKTQIVFKIIVTLYRCQDITAPWQPPQRTAHSERHIQMTHKILHIDSAITGDNSVSRGLTRAVVDLLHTKHAEAEVTYRDLVANPVGQIDGAWLGAVSTDAEARNTEQAEAANLSETLINELKDTDTLVLGMPVYNFMIPSQLKSWIDQIARSGITFRYSETGPEGLVKNTRAIIAYTADGTAFGSDIDFASRYIRHLLGFIGITDVHFIAADKGAFDPEGSLKQAHAQIAELTV